MLLRGTFMSSKRLASQSLIILSISVLVFSQPPIRIVQEPADALTLPGGNVLLQCVFVDSKSLLVSAEWFRNGEPTTGLPRHKEFHNPGTTITIGLQIENAMRTDDGASYHCSPVGQPNITSELVSIIVADVPEFSENNNTISVLSTTFSTATIKWIPATTLPNAAVSRYIIRAYDDTGLHRVYLTNDGNTLNFTISELEPSTKYHINVAANNTVGQSAPTRNISLTTRQFILPLPPTNVDVCVSFDTTNNPTLQVQWQAPPTVFDQTNQYYVYYGRNSSTTKQRVIFDSTDAIIPISQDYLSEMVSVQISTVNENGESLLTDPFLQYINPLHSVEQLQVTSSSATLQCRLACLTSELHCRIVSLRANSTEVPVTITTQIDQQQLILRGLEYLTVYSYCVSAFVNNTTTGLQVCGILETGEFQPQATKASSGGTSLSSGVIAGIIGGIIVITLMILILIVLLACIFCRKANQSEKRSISNIYSVTEANHNGNSFQQTTTQVDFAALHIKPSSKPPARNSLLGPYSEVVLSKSKTYDDKNTGSLKQVEYADLDLSSSGECNAPDPTMDTKRVVYATMNIV